MRRSNEYKFIGDAIRAARRVQEFLWGDANENINFEEWLRMLRKRIVKLEEVNIRKPHAAVEVQKRLLQVAAVSVALMGRIAEDGLPPENHPDAPEYLHGDFATRLLDVPKPAFNVHQGVRVPKMRGERVEGSENPELGYINAARLVWCYDVCFHTDPDHLEAFIEEDLVRCPNSVAADTEG